jgi:hypothetical protein
MNADEAIADAEHARRLLREAVERSRALQEYLSGRRFPPVPWNRELYFPERPKLSTRR